MQMKWKSTEDCLYTHLSKYIEATCSVCGSVWGENLHPGKRVSSPAQRTHNPSLRGIRDEVKYSTQFFIFVSFISNSWKCERKLRACCWRTVCQELGERSKHASWTASCHVCICAYQTPPSQLIRDACRLRYKSQVLLWLTDISVLSVFKTRSKG